MRICHVIESASGGSAGILVSLALHAVRRGHEVHVVYSPDRAEERLIEQLRNGGCASVRQTPMRRAVGPHDVADGVQLRKVLRSLGPLDIVHSHSSKAGALARTFGKVGGAAQIYSPHGFYTMTGEAPFYIGPVERALSWATDRIVAVSDFERRHGISLGISPMRISTVLNGIEPYQPVARAEARRELGVSDDAFAIGFVGRLTAQKNPLEAIAVIDAVEHPGAELILIGDGDLRPDAEAKAKSSRAIFAGSREAKRLFSAFDCLLCTSKYEGMPVAFLEALNCGVPIVSYPVGGTEELVGDGDTGFVTRPNPVEAARAIDRIAAMPMGDRERMRSACFAMAAAHSSEAMGDATLDLYRDVLNDRR